MEFLCEMKNQYYELLTHKWISIFEKILDEENYLPIQVKIDERLQDIQSLSPTFNALTCR